MYPLKPYLGYSRTPVGTNHVPPYPLLRYLCIHIGRTDTLMIHEPRGDKTSHNLNNTVFTSIAHLKSAVLKYYY